MNTKLVMAASAIFMGAVGLAATFLPQEIGAAINVSFPLVIQLLGALYLGFAMQNWMAKDSLIGGIYNRPVLVGNVTHFAIGAITLLKLVVGESTPPILAATVIYVLFAIGFGMLLFTSPVKRESVRVE